MDGNVRVIDPGANFNLPEDYQFMKENTNPQFQRTKDSVSNGVKEAIESINFTGIIENMEPTEPEKKLVNQHLINDDIYKKFIPNTIDESFVISGDENSDMMVIGNVVYFEDQLNNVYYEEKDNFSILDLSVKTTYFNRSVYKDVTIINRSGFKFPLPISNDINIDNFFKKYMPKVRFDPVTNSPYNLGKREQKIFSNIVDLKEKTNKKIGIIQEYVLDASILSKLQELIVNNRFGSIEDNFTKFIAYLSRECDYFFNIINGSMKKVKVYILITYIVNIDNLINNKHIISKIKNTGDIIFIGDYDRCPVKGVSSTYLDVETNNILRGNDIKNGIFVKVIKNTGGHCNYYYRIGNEIVEVSSEVNNGVEDGIHVYSIKELELYENGEIVMKYELSDKLIHFDDAESNHFYLSRELAEKFGNPENVFKAELNKINNDKIKLENEKIKLNQKVIEMEKDMMILKNELDQYKTNKEYEKTRIMTEIDIDKAKLDIDKARTINYYSERSLDRKDTSESIKMVPALVGAVAGMVGLSVGLLSKRSLVALVPSGAVMTTLLCIGSYEVFKFVVKSSPFKAVVSGITTAAKTVGSFAISAVKSTASAIYSVGKSAANVVYNVGKTAANMVGSAVSFVGETVGSVFGGISSFLFG